MCRTGGINFTEGINTLPGGGSLGSSGKQSTVHALGGKDDLLQTRKRFDYWTKFLLD